MIWKKGDLVLSIRTNRLLVLNEDVGRKRKVSVTVLGFGCGHSIKAHPENFTVPPPHQIALYNLQLAAREAT